MLLWISVEVDQEVGATADRLDSHCVRLIGRMDECRRLVLWFAEPDMATHEAIDAFDRVDIDVCHRVEQIAQLDPRHAVEEEIVPLDDHDGIVCTYNDPVGAGFVGRAIEVGKGDVGVRSSQPTHGADELLGGEGLRRTFHVPQAPMVEDLVGEVEAIHRNDDRVEVTSESSGKRRLPAARRSGDAEQVPLRPGRMTANPSCKVRSSDALDGHRLV